MLLNSFLLTKNRQQTTLKHNFDHKFQILRFVTRRCVRAHCKLGTETNFDDATNAIRIKLSNVKI